MFSFDFFFALAANEEDYVHPAHCGLLSCRKTGKRKRENNPRKPRQRAGEHRRVLAPVVWLSVVFLSFHTIIFNTNKPVSIGSTVIKNHVNKRR